MPTISMFFGIIIRMFYADHMPPHFHAEYQGHKAIFDMDGVLIEGELPGKQSKIVEAWALIHHDELLANWDLARDNAELFKIEPLR